MSSSCNFQRKKKTDAKGSSIARETSILLGGRIVAANVIGPPLLLLHTSFLDMKRLANTLIETEA